MIQRLVIYSVSGCVGWISGALVSKKITEGVVSINKKSNQKNNQKSKK